MKPRKLNAEQQYKLDLELVKRSPLIAPRQKPIWQRTLRISKYKVQASSKIRVGNFKGRKRCISIRPKKKPEQH